MVGVPPLEKFPWLLKQEKRTDDGIHQIDALILPVPPASLYVFFPNEERVKALVEQGELPGRIENGRAILGALTPEHHRLLFDIRKLTPPVEYPKMAKDDYPHFPVPLSSFHKLPAELDPCKKGDRDE